jgi:hypothetical protein
MELVPFDKSWVIRHGVLDLLDGHAERAAAVLDAAGTLPDDLQALRRVLEQWPAGESLDVGESGTLYRFLRFAAWARGENREFVMRGTLPRRPMCDNPAIVRWPLERLLALDGGTSQWASAALLSGNRDPLPNPSPVKLLLTAEAIHSRRPDGYWEPRYDSTIERQLRALPTLIAGDGTFEPEHSEDYALARAFEFITANEGESRWPQLRGHESDRIAAMESGLIALPCITSRDHRVVEALVARCLRDGLTPQVEHPEAVNKSWPQFWDALTEIAA